MTWRHLKYKEFLNIKLYEMLLSKSDYKQCQCTKIRNQHEYFYIEHSSYNNNVSTQKCNEEKVRIF